MTDTAVVVPVNKIIVMTVTGGDYPAGHSAFMKQDGVPGRIAQLWFNERGYLLGQCSELAADHICQSR